jgi:hypothetical protein
MNGGKICPAMSVQEYNRKVSGFGSRFTEYAKEKLQCVLCVSEVQRSCLATHQGSKKCIHGRKEWSALHPTDEEEEETPLPTFFMPPSVYCISIRKDAVELILIHIQKFFHFHDFHKRSLGLFNLFFTSTGSFDNMCC